MAAAILARISTKLFGTNLRRILILLLCVALPYLWAASVRQSVHGAIRATDFGAVYYGARCAMQHNDPYNPQTVLREFKAAGGWFSKPSPTGQATDQAVVTRIIYPPTAFLVMAPLAELPWTAARTVWLCLIAGLLVLAGLLVWDLAAEAPKIAGCMIGFILLNCVILLVSGNPVGFVAPSCAIAAWCFLKNRSAWLGVVLLAVSLVLKPHDAGFVWLYFLLAGGAGRKRALQTLAAAVVLGICAAIWIAPVSPHWIPELRSNIAFLSAPGGPADPSPIGVSSRSFSPILSLQSLFSIFNYHPKFYNAASYLVAGGLILAWAFATLRKRASRQGALLALAAVSILTLLPVYHRADDAKLLLLTIPACAILWAGGGARRWLALALTSASLFVTGAVPIILEDVAVAKLPLDLSRLGGKLTLLALQPAPLILLATGGFYLWALLKYEPPRDHAAQTGAAGERAELAAT